MRDQRLPKEKQAVALEYFRRIYKSRATYEEADILASMPPAMRMDFSTHLYQKFLAGVPIFRGLPAGLIHSLCTIVKPMFSVRGQIIFSEGSSGKEMYRRTPSTHGLDLRSDRD